MGEYLLHDCRKMECGVKTGVQLSLIAFAGSKRPKDGSSDSQVGCCTDAIQGGQFVQGLFGAQI